MSIESWFRREVRTEQGAIISVCYLAPSLGVALDQELEEYCGSEWSLEKIKVNPDED